MGMVKKALEKNEKRLENSYPLYTEHGVIALLNNLHSVWGEVFKGNYDALILIIDLEQALSDAFLTIRQREAIDLVFYQDLTPKEAAKVMGIQHEQEVRGHISAAAKKVAKYLEGTEGYANHG